jgi:hypothetical protein
MKTREEKTNVKKIRLFFVATFGIRLGRKEMFLSRSYVFLLFAFLCSTRNEANNDRARVCLPFHISSFTKTLLCGTNHLNCPLSHFLSKKQLK